MMLRTIVCGCCRSKFTERAENEGWPGWGQLMGIVLNGDANPYLCSDCLYAAAEFVDQRAEEVTQ